MYHILTMDRLHHAHKSTHHTLEEAREVFRNLDRRYYQTAMLIHNDTILAR